MARKPEHYAWHKPPKALGRTLELADARVRDGPPVLARYPCDAMAELERRVAAVSGPCFVRFVEP